MTNKSGQFALFGAVKEVCLCCRRDLNLGYKGCKTR